MYSYRCMHYLSDHLQLDSHQKLSTKLTLLIYQGASKNKGAIDAFVRSITTDDTRRLTPTPPDGATREVREAGEERRREQEWARGTSISLSFGFLS